MEDLQSFLRNKLHAFIKEQLPDLFFILQEENTMAIYVDYYLSLEGSLSSLENEASGAEAREVMLTKLFDLLKPSRFLYIKEVFEREFPTDYHRLWVLRTVTETIMELTKETEDIFSLCGFTNSNVQYAAVIRKIGDFLKTALQ